MADASRELARNISRASSPPSPPLETDAGDGKLKVYIDASLSMAGFVNPNKYSSFDEFIDEIGNSLPGCLLFKYGQTHNQSVKGLSDITNRANFGQDLHRPSFYNLSYNPDDFLITELTKEGSSALSVVITDGVYSEPAGNAPPPVVEAIKSWMERGNVFGIFILSSEFNGRVYSERRRMMLPTSNISARPFYAFVFSRTEEPFKELQRKLQQEFPSMRTILFSDKAVNHAIDLPKNRQSTYAYDQQANYSWQMFDAGLFKERGQPVVNYGVKFTASPEYPATEFGVNVDAEYYRWVNGQFKKADGPPPTGFKSEPKVGLAGGGQPALPAPAAGNGDVVIEVVIPKDTSCDYSFYSLKMNPSVRNIRRDVREISTRDDGTLENASKTFRFFELVAALTDVHFKTWRAKRASPAVFITVANH